MAEISESDFQEWRAVYQRASTSVQNRLLKLEESYELIEKVRERSISLLQKTWFPENFSLSKEPINKDRNILTHHLLSNLLWSKHQQILIMFKAFAKKSLELLCVDLFFIYVYNFGSKLGQSSCLLASVHYCFYIIEDKHPLLHTRVHTSYILYMCTLHVFIYS